MGCVVNGPGEARSADLGIAAGKKRGHLFIKGQVVKVVDEKDMVDALVKEGRLIAEEGVDARLAAADTNAAQIAEEDVQALLNVQGDINNFEQKTKSVLEITTNKDIENYSVEVAIISLEKIIKNSIDKKKLDKIYISSVDEAKKILKNKSI